MPSTKARARLLIVVLALLCAIWETGCKAELTTTVEVAPDGSGRLSVRMSVDQPTDRSFKDLTGRSFADNALVSDVIGAGWRVNRDSTESGSSVTASREFATPAEAGPAVDALVGAPPRVFTEFGLYRRQGTGTVSFRFNAAVGELGKELSSTLAATIGSEAASMLETRYHVDPSRDLAFAVVLRLPGSIGQNDADRVENGMLRWDLRPGAARSLSAESRYYKWPDFLVAGAGTLALAALLVLFAGDLRRRRRRGSKRAGNGATLLPGAEP